LVRKRVWKRAMAVEELRIESAGIANVRGQSCG